MMAILANFLFVKMYASNKVTVGAVCLVQIDPETIIAYLQLDLVVKVRLQPLLKHHRTCLVIQTLWLYSTNTMKTPRINIVLTTFRKKIVKTSQVTELLFIQPTQVVRFEKVNLTTMERLEFAVSQSVHVAHPNLMDQIPQYPVNSIVTMELTERVSRNLFVLTEVGYLQNMIINPTEITHLLD